MFRIFAFKRITLVFFQPKSYFPNIDVLKFRKISFSLYYSNIEFF